VKIIPGNRGKQSNPAITDAFVNGEREFHLLYEEMAIVHFGQAILLHVFYWLHPELLSKRIMDITNNSFCCITKSYTKKL